MIFALRRVCGELWSRQHVEFVKKVPHHKEPVLKEHNLFYRCGYLDDVRVWSRRLNMLDTALLLLNLQFHWFHTRPGKQTKSSQLGNSHLFHNPQPLQRRAGLNTPSHLDFGHLQVDWTEANGLWPGFSARFPNWQSSRTSQTRWVSNEKCSSKACERIT